MKTNRFWIRNLKRISEFLYGCWYFILGPICWIGAFYVGITISFLGGLGLMWLIVPFHLLFTKINNFISDL